MARSTPDSALKLILEERAEILAMVKESIESDIQNEFLTPEGYLAKIKEYYDLELANFKQANKDGLDKANLSFIMDRLETVKKEIKDFESEQQEMEQ